MKDKINLKDPMWQLLLGIVLTLYVILILTGNSVIV